MWTPVLFAVSLTEPSVSKVIVSSAKPTFVVTSPLWIMASSTTMLGAYTSTDATTLAFWMPNLSEPPVCKLISSVVNETFVSGL